MHDDFDDLLLDDATWWLRITAGLRLLADNDPAQQALWPIDDFLGTKRYVGCPRRGTHMTLVECWLCWTSVAWGHADRCDVLHRDAWEV